MTGWHVTARSTARVTSGVRIFRYCQGCRVADLVGRMKNFLCAVACQDALMGAAIIAVQLK